MGSYVLLFVKPLDAFISVKVPLWDNNINSNSSSVNAYRVSAMLNTAQQLDIPQVILLQPNPLGKRESFSMD